MSEPDKPVEKYSLQEVAEIVVTEGLGYAIRNYLGADNIADPELSRLWGECETLMNRIESMIPELRDAEPQADDEEGGDE